MSHKFYDSQWQEAMEELSHLVQLEVNPNYPNPPPPAIQIASEKNSKSFMPTKNEKKANSKASLEMRLDKNAAFQHFAKLYFRYIHCLRLLEDCYDQIVQPQKRASISHVLQVVISRVCQLKAELVKFNPITRSDYLYLEDMLLELDQPIASQNISVPRYYREDETLQRSQFQDRVDQFYDQFHIPVIEEDSGELRLPELSVAQAIRIIQRNERGRQGRLRGFLMAELREGENRKNSQANRDPVVAARLIQRLVRGRLDRIQTARNANEELEFIGMSGKPISDSIQPPTRQSAIRIRRKKKQVENLDEYKQALVDLAMVVEKTEGSDLKQEMIFPRRQWWNEYVREHKGKPPSNFDDFYRSQSQDSSMPKQEEKKEARNRTRRVATPAEKVKPSAKKEKNTKSIKGDKKKLGEFEGEDFYCRLSTGPSQLVINLIESLADYRNRWASLDESDNFLQKYNVEMARERVRTEVKERIRVLLDQEMLEQLNNVRIGGKRKPREKGAKPAPRSQSAPPPRVAKKKVAKPVKKKKCCEGERLCANLDFDDVISHLVFIGVLKNLPRNVKTFNDFVGDYSQLSTAQLKQFQSNMIRPDPTLMQLRQAVVEYAVLPQGSKFVKSNSPLINRMLLAGPSGSGKSFLSKAVAYATNAFWFDLSFQNIVGKTGSRADNVKLVHMVFDAAKVMQPSIIFIDDCELMFATGRRKTEAEEFIKLKRDIISHTHGLDSSHRVLVIGNSRFPFDEHIDRKEFIDFWLGGKDEKRPGKILFCPHPDYPSRYKLWNSLTAAKGLNIVELHRADKLDLRALAHISEGYTAGSIVQAINHTLPPRRVKKINEMGIIDTQAFVSALSKTPYNYKEDFQKFRDFFDDTTGDKHRKKMMNESKQNTNEAKRKPRR